MIKRIISSVVGLPLVLGILIWGTPPWVLSFFGLIQFLVALEIMRIFVEEGLGFPKLNWSLAFTSTLVFVALLVAPREETLTLLTVFLLGAAVISAILPGSMEQRSQRAPSLVLALAYGILPWLMIAGLYQKADNERLVILLLSIAWAGDTAAYFCGRTWGRRPMAPLISPRKTWEGALGGFIASSLAAVVVSEVYGGQLGSWPYLLTVGATCAVAGQCGDLFKSVFKRHRKIKDSGRLLPGHGGLLDRMDSALMAAPVLTLFF
jgi:phosphatidate cytidylyltransferase